MHRGPSPPKLGCWRLRSLRGKLLIPIAGLMLLSLLGSTLAFAGSTALTQRQLLEQQTADEAERVVAALSARVESAMTAAGLLANAPEVLRTVDLDSAEALGTLNSRAVLVRGRFDVDLLQVYDREGQARAAGLVLIGENGKDLPAVRGNYNQLVQVVTNLVANAVNYTSASMVRVRTYLDAEHHRICLEVRDTGMGIPEEELAHIFERFYRSPRVRDSGIQGTGLGLAIVKEIVTLHGGGIEVESLAGKGSTFRVWLPPAGEALSTGQTLTDH